MNLDHYQQFGTLDTEDMLGHINAAPEQLQMAWQYGLSQPLPETFSAIRQVVFCGMGSAATGGDLLGALMQESSQLPLFVCRHYDLPAWVQGASTLVIASSFSGDTEETLSAYDQAVERGLPVIAITTGGRLADKARQNPQAILWQFEHHAPPSATLPWHLGVLLALAHRLGWLTDLDTDIAEAVSLMQQSRERYNAEIPTAQNPAKRQAGQWIERLPVFYGSGAFEVVARRWKTLMNENAKLFAAYEALPEANHNAAAGIIFPEALMSKLAVCFIESPTFDHPRVALRHQLTRMLYLQAGIMIDSFMPQGESLLAQLLHAIYFADYASYYAALANDANPSAIEPIAELEAMLQE